MNDLILLLFRVWCDVNKNKTYISMSCSSHVFTKTKFQIHEKRILNFHKSQQFLFVFVNHINLIYEVFFLWKFGIRFSWKYVVRSSSLTKVDNRVNKRVICMIISYYIYGSFDSLANFITLKLESWGSESIPLVTHSSKVSYKISHLPQL